MKFVFFNNFLLNIHVDQFSPKKIILNEFTVYELIKISIYFFYFLAIFAMFLYILIAFLVLKLTCTKY